MWWLLGFVACGSGEGGNGQSVHACSHLEGSPEQRLVACLDRLPTVDASAATETLIADIAESGKVLLLGGSLSSSQPTRTAIGDAGLLQALLGDDERAAADLLRESGVRGVVVHRGLTSGMDRDRRVVARLAHHDHLDWFQLRRVAEELFVYTVRKSSARVSLKVGDRMLRGLRARLERRPRDDWPVQTWNPASLRVIATVRLQGSLLAMRHAVQADDSDTITDELLDELARKLRVEWARRAERQGHGALADRLGEVRLEVHIVKERAPVEPRGSEALADLWEMGVDGMMFRQRPGPDLEEKFSFMPGSEQVTQSLKSADAFLHFSTDYHGWFDRRPWTDRRTQLDVIRDQHFMEAHPGGGSAKAVRLLRGMPEVPQQANGLGREWWLRNLRDDNRFEYKYWPVQNRRSSEYNEVRHIMAARDLADVWRYRRDPRYLDGAKAAMDWLAQFTVEASDDPIGPLPHPPQGTMLFRYPSYALQKKTKVQANQKLGTVAVGLLGWIAWAQASGSHAEDDRIRQMARFVTEMQEADGRFRPYLVHHEHAYVDNRNDIVPGEAMLALGMVAEYFDESSWIDGYERFLSYYRPWFRERAARRSSTGRWPHSTYRNSDRLEIVQFGPWSVMAAKQVYDLTGNEAAAAFGLEVADWMIDNYQWTEERAPWPDYVGGYYKIPEELPAMQTFCYSEGTAAAYSIASRFAPERKVKYEQSTAQAIRFLEVMQFDDLDSYFVARPDQVRGGIKYTMNENKVRIDYVGHGLSTLSQWLDARADDPAVETDLHDPSDLRRPAGSRGSVPALSYGSALRVPGQVPR